MRDGRRRETCTRTARACRAPGRARRDPQPHVARGLRARAARQLRERPASRPPRCVERFPDDRDAVGRTRELAERLAVRPDAGARLPLPRLLGWRAIRPMSSSARRLRAEASASGSRPTASARAAPASGLREELALIAELGLSGFFLLHHEVLELAARDRRPQLRGPGSPRHALPPGRGRGSSVGSIVCYLTGLSHVDPVAAEPLARPLPEPRDGRRARHRPRLPARHPRAADRRRHRALRPRACGARRDASRPTTRAARSATSARRSACRAPSSSGWRGSPRADPHRVEDELHAPSRRPRRSSSSRRWRALGWLCKQIAGLPRHISQHPGGMVISTAAAVELVPVEPAAMDGRQICQWDKDSCADAGFLKIDLLGLGHALGGRGLRRPHRARPRGDGRPLADPARRPGASTRRSRRADTVGDFQIESRAQMQRLLRTRPENLDDLTVQVALVRPGPIQGGAVHPYIERRAAAARGSIRSYPPVRPSAARGAAARDARRRRLPGSGARGGDGARRLLGRRGGGAAPRDEPQAQPWRRSRPSAQRFVEGALAKRRRRRRRPTGSTTSSSAFSGFGFPKSHAAAFALLAYQSAWLRRYYPAEFLCALLNAQPMGFYPPASLVRDGSGAACRCCRPT